MSTAHHPQTNGQSERVKKCLETYLRCMTHIRPKKWVKWLSMAEWWYNTNYHHSIRMTPFEALYGYKPVQFGIGPMGEVQPKEAGEWLLDRTKMVQVLKENLQMTVERMEKYALTGLKESLKREIGFI